MGTVTFIVEGKEDQQFLADFIRHRFDIEIEDRSFVKMDGNAPRLGQGGNKILIQQRAEKGKNVLIFDADANYNETKGAIEDSIKEHNLRIDSLFLFPDNNSTGNLESLLRQIAKHAEVFTCIDQYGTCINGLGTPGLSAFDNKTTIFVYHNSFNIDDTGGSKGRSRSYSASWWNLNATALEPLYNFLRPILTE